MPSISLRRLRTEIGSLLHVRVTARNDGFSVSQDFPVYPDEIRLLAEEMATFPRSPDHVVAFEYGASPKFYCHVRLRVLVLRPSGYSAIELTYDNRKEPPEKAEGLLYLPCYPATVNELGRLLMGWASDPEQDLEHEWLDD